MAKEDKDKEKKPKQGIPDDDIQEPSIDKDFDPRRTSIIQPFDKVDPEGKVEHIHATHRHKKDEELEKLRDSGLLDEKDLKEETQLPKEEKSIELQETVPSPHLTPADIKAEEELFGNAATLQPIEPIKKLNPVFEFNEQKEFVPTGDKDMDELQIVNLRKIKHLEEEIGVYNKDIIKLKEETEICQSHIEGLVNKDKKSQVEISVLTEENDKYKAEIKQKDINISELDSAKRAESRKRFTLEQTLKENNQKINELKTAVEEKENQIDIQKQNLQTLNSELGESKKEYDNLDKQVEERNVDISNFNEHLKDYVLKTAAMQVTKEEVDRITAEKEEEIGLLKTQIGSLESQVEEIATENKTHKETLDTNKKEIEEAEKLGKYWILENNKLKETNEVLKENNKEFQAVLEEKEELSNELSEYKIQAETELANVLAEFEKYKTEARQDMEASVEFETYKKQVEEEKQDLVERIDEIEAEKVSLTEELDNIKEQSVDVSNKYVEKEFEATELRSELEQTQDEKQLLEQKVEELQSAPVVEDHSEELEALKQKVAEYETYKEQNTALKQKVAELEENNVENISLKDKVSTLEKKLAKERTIPKSELNAEKSRVNTLITHRNKAYNFILDRSDAIIERYGAKLGLDLEVLNKQIGCYRELTKNKDEMVNNVTNLLKDYITNSTSFINTETAYIDAESLNEDRDKRALGKRKSTVTTTKKKIVRRKGYLVDVDSMSVTEVKDLLGDLLEEKMAKEGIEFKATWDALVGLNEELVSKGWAIDDYALNQSEDKVEILTEKTLQFSKNYKILENKLLKTTDQRDHAKQWNQFYSKEREKMITDLLGLSKDLDEVNVIIEDYKNLEKNYNKKLIAKETKINELTYKLQSTETERERLEKERAYEQDEFNTLQGELDIAIYDLEEANKKKKKLDYKIETYQIKAEKARSRNKVLEDEIKRHRKKNEKLTEKVDSLSEAQSEYESKPQYEAQPEQTAQPEPILTTEKPRSNRVDELFNEFYRGVYERNVEYDKEMEKLIASEELVESN